MAAVNVHRPEWDFDWPDPPFRSRGMRLGPRTGAEELGATLFELAPGGASSPYHFHHGNEEMLLVLAGRPSLRGPQGERPLEPGEVMAFPRGPAGAHRLTNPSDEPARFVIFSTMRFPEVAEHPDTGALLAVTGPMEGKAFPAGTDVPFMETVVSAMEASDRHQIG